MVGHLDNHEISIPCRACGNSSKKTLGWIKTNNEFKCQCGTVLEISAEKLLRTGGAVDRSISDLKAKLKKFGK